MLAATWAVAGASFLAFLGTLYLLNLQRRQLHLLTTQEFAREDDRRKEQARLVSAWAKRVTRIATTNRVVDDVEVTSARVTVVVSNRSNEPVWDCCARVKSTWGPSYDLEWQRIVVMPPGDRQIVIDIDLPVALRDVTPPVEVTFTDAAGRHWRRRDQGGLQQAEGDRPPESAWPDPRPLWRHYKPHRHEWLLWASSREHRQLQRTARRIAAAARAAMSAEELDQG